MTILTSCSFKILISRPDIMLDVDSRAYLAQLLTYGWKPSCLHSLYGGILLVKVEFIF